MNSSVMTKNISLPKPLYADAKKAVAKRRYVSVSELVRDAVRRVLYPNPRLTINGFTKEFEDMVLKREKDSLENDIVWEGKESDLVRYVKSPKTSRLYKRLGRFVGK